MFDFLDRETYYSQWQSMPRDPDKWQVSTAQRTHKARKQIISFVTENCKSILDCGCGIGLDYESYRNNGVTYRGIDITPKFVEAAQKRGVPAKQGDILNIPYPDNSFDAVYCKDVLLHLLFDDWKKALDEMFRVARKYIITLEPAWSADTTYTLREKHGIVVNGKEPRVLRFLHNTYSITDIMRWAVQKGLTAQKWTGFDLERSAALRMPCNWQVTIFTKE